MKFYDFADFLLDFHVVVVAMVTNSILFSGNGGGLRKGFNEN